MSTTTSGAQPGARDRLVFALVLIVVGLAAVVLQATEATPNIGGWVVLIIGVGLFGAFAYTRRYGFLIPAGIMTGLGAGIIVSENVVLADEATGGVIVLGLGLGFLSIWAVGALLSVPKSTWWPIVPGGILALIGALLIIGGTAVQLLDYWGVIVIGIGLIVLWRAFATRSQA